MKSSFEILDILQFIEKFDLNNIQNPKVKRVDLQVKIYCGSPDDFRHPLIYKYEYSIKDDQTIYSLDIFIEENRADIIPNIHLIRMSLWRIKALYSLNLRIMRLP